jgi:hypothetical protein
VARAGSCRTRPSATSWGAHSGPRSIVKLRSSMAPRNPPIRKARWRLSLRLAATLVSEGSAPLRSAAWTNPFSAELPDHVLIVVMPPPCPPLRIHSTSESLWVSSQVAVPRISGDTDRALGKVVSAACSSVSPTLPRSLTCSRTTPLSAWHVRASRAASLHVSSGSRWSPHTVSGRALVGRG